MSRFYIGTSGYSYAYWKNRFYPEKLPAKDWLSYYSHQFNTLELNHSFYKFPELKTFQRINVQTSSSFKVSVKAHKIITHSLRMKNVKSKIYEFTDIVREGLRDKLACVLFQLPPSYTYSEERMNDILENLTHASENVVEFRHTSWWKEEVYQQLKKEKLTFCSVSYPGLPEDNIKTSTIFYKRMHGRSALFESSYSSDELKNLAEKIPERGKSFIYFNNTTFEAAYTNARELMEMASAEFI